MTRMVAGVTCSGEGFAVAVREGDELVGHRVLRRDGDVTAWAFRCAGAAACLAGTADVVIVEEAAEPTPNAGAEQRERLDAAAEVIRRVVDALAAVPTPTRVVATTARGGGTIPTSVRRSRPLPRAWRVSFDAADEKERHDGR